jgi:putative (di)nucleoside polyphosphate hydrolase
MVVLNSENKIFLGERSGSVNVWQFPQGGAEPEDTLEENVLRELEEELGAPRSCFQIIRRLNASHEYDFRSPPSYAIGKWRGQSQSFWLVKFLGTDEEIHLERYAKELSRFQWVDIDDVLKVADPVRSAGYRKIIDEVRELTKEK